MAIKQILYFGKNLLKVGKIDILLDDGGHANLQQITTLVDTNFIKPGGMIIIEDTHTSFMRDMI